MTRNPTCQACQAPQSLGREVCVWIVSSASYPPPPSQLTARQSSWGGGGGLNRPLPLESPRLRAFIDSNRGALDGTIRARCPFQITQMPRYHDPSNRPSQTRHNSAVSQPCPSFEASDQGGPPVGPAKPLLPSRLAASMILLRAFHETTVSALPAARAGLGGTGGVRSEPTCRANSS